MKQLYSLHRFTIMLGGSIKSWYLIVTAATLFCATQTNSTLAIGENQVINFNGVTISGSGWDSSFNTFTASVNGYYWIQFSVAMPNNQPTNVRLIGLLSRRFPSIVRGSGQVETASRVELALLNPGNSIYLVSDNQLVSNSGVPISFSAFHINSFMNPVVAFSFGLSEPKMTAGTIAFNMIMVDTHTDWQSSTSQYNVSVGGIWVFTLQAGDHPDDYRFAGETVMSISGQSSRLKIYHGYSALSRDQESITVILTLNSGDAITTTLTEAPIYSDSTFPTSLMGFLYSPNVQPAYAWCVSMNTSIMGPQDPLPFNAIHTNVGNTWDSSSFVIRAPESGIFYVTISGAQYYGTPYMELNMNILQDGVLKASLYSGTGVPDGSTGYRTRSRAIMLYMEHSSELRVTMPQGSSSYGSPDIVTSFSGFRITS
jgi:hypothetical protein